MVMRDVKLIAHGTAAQPIIFTWEGNSIKPGMIASPNLPNELVGQWGDWLF